MPPAQCPECGRFLAKAFVAGLSRSRADCPTCGTELTSDRFSEAADAVDDVSDPVEPPASAIRPPDLDPVAVRRDDEGRPDPLEGWDRPEGQVVDLGRFRAGRQPPPDGAIVLGAGAAGALIGALLARRRAVGAAVGAAAGVAAAATARQVWRLPD